MNDGKPLEYIACGIAYFYHAQPKVAVMPSDIAGVIRNFGIQYSTTITDSIARGALRMLDKKGYLVFDEDKFAGTTLKIDKDTLDQRYYQYVQYDTTSLERKVNRLGVDWLKQIFSNPEFWSFLPPEASLGSLPSVETIPASDRLVTLDHNSAVVKEIRQATSELVQQIRRGNDLGDLTVDEANAAANEVYQIGLFFEADMVRPSTVMGLARPTLRWIADKAGGALIGTGALALLALIASFFGFTIS